MLVSKNKEHVSPNGFERWGNSARGALTKGFREVNRSAQQNKFLAELAAPNKSAG
jgi:hypothetical protein